MVVKIPLFTVGDPTNMAFDLKTSVITSFLSFFDKCINLITVWLSASFIPLAKINIAKVMLIYI